jgi:hypothetical protein
MPMMGNNNEACVNDEVELRSEEGEETLTQTGRNPDSPNSPYAATVKLDSPEDLSPNSPISHSAPTVTLRPPQARD